jgi:hypothetical protein
MEQLVQIINILDQAGGAPIFAYFQSEYLDGILGGSIKIKRDLDSVCDLVLAL